MTNDIMSRLNEAIATAQMQCEDGYFHDDEWDIVISEKLYNKLKEECNVVYDVKSVEELQRYNGIDIKVVPNWSLGSDVLLLVKKMSLKGEVKETYKKGYAKAMEDIQEAVRMLLAMDYNDKALYFGGSHITAEILSEFDVREIVERLEAYKKEQSEIRVGDEVEINDSNVIVTYVRGSKMYVLYGDGATEEVTVNHTEIRKTGRHFDEVEKLIEILKGGEDSDKVSF